METQLSHKNPQPLSLIPRHQTVRLLSSIKELIRGALMGAERKSTLPQGQATKAPEDRGGQTRVSLLPTGGALSQVVTSGQPGSSLLPLFLHGKDYTTQNALPS